VKAEDSAERILYLIKTQGPMSAKALALELKITTMGARQHIAKLAEKGLIKDSEEKRDRGRPSCVWSLTEQGHGKYTDRHASLTVDLIKLVEVNFGAQGLDKLIQSRAQQSLTMYLEQLTGLDIAAKVQRLAQLRSEEGYMARALQDEGGFVLIENHCPICAAATACQGFCKTELENFQACFAAEATVERSQHILEGDSRCCYRIQPL